MAYFSRLIFTYFCFSGVFADPDLKFVLTPHRLHAPIMKHSAVYDGRDSIFIVGGHDDDRVSRYNLKTGGVEVIGNFMRVYSGAAAMDGDEIVYVGGYVTGKGHSTGVYRYSTTDRNYSLVASLPVGIERMGMAWDFENRTAYIFGGWGESHHHDTVLRYDENWGHGVAQVARLPERRSGPTAVWDPRDGVAYVFGGGDSNVRNRPLLRDIFRFDPAGGGVAASVARVSVGLPSEMEWPCAVNVNGLMYVIGDTGRITRFDPKTKKVESVAVKGWTRPLAYSACVHVPRQGRIYLLGGYGSFRQGQVQEKRAEIAYIDLGAGADSEGVYVPTGDTRVTNTNKVWGGLHGVKPGAGWWE